MAMPSNCPKFGKEANSPKLEVGVPADRRESLVGRHDDADESNSLETIKGVKTKVATQAQALRKKNTQLHGDQRCT